MTDLNAQEKQLLRTAQKLRGVVTADLRKALAPASSAFVQAIKLEPELTESVRNMPPEAWALLAKHVAKVISVTSLTEVKEQTFKVASSLKSYLTSAGSKDASDTATRVVLAAFQAAVRHRKSASPQLLQAVHQINEVQAEIDLLREFI